MRVHLRPEISKSDVALEYLRMSAGFLEAAEQLNAAMVSGAWESNYFRGVPAKLLAFHSVELFLKACIARATPDNPILGHSLAALYSEFCRLYPTLSFDPLFIVEPLVPYPELVEEAVSQNRQFHETLRYPTDRKGDPWAGTRGFSPDLFVKTIAKLRADLERVSDEIFPDA